MALDGRAQLTQRPSRFTFGKETGGSVGPMAGLDECGKSHPIGILFLFSCSVFVLYPYLFLRLHSLAFCLLSLLYNTNIYAPGGIRSPDRPAHSEALYPLSYAGPQKAEACFKNLYTEFGHAYSSLLEEQLPWSQQYCTFKPWSLRVEVLKQRT